MAAEERKPVLRLMNSAVMPRPGHYHTVQISEKRFVALLKEHEETFVSYVGYPQCQTFIQQITGIEIPLNRELTPLEDGDLMLICRLAYRVGPYDKGRWQEEEYEFFLSRFREWRKKPGS